mmetsp:Transcript_76168/g.235851  ORF Transcript_76168/g.235851 Transcript_76168/m.235851 type:complete len:99 (+) Transcript_76168:95-391(+)
MATDPSPQEALARLSVPRVQELLSAAEGAQRDAHGFGMREHASGTSWIDFANAMVSIFAVKNRLPELPGRAPPREGPRPRGGAGEGGGQGAGERKRAF